MQQKRFQNRIAESRFSFLITATLCILIWIGAGLAITASEWDWSDLSSNPFSGVASHILITLPCLVLSTYLMVELNNVNALIRIFSRMVSCTFLTLMTMTTFLFTSVPAAVVTLCIIAFYAALFHSYQHNDGTGWIFHAFLCIGIASLFFVQILFFVPIIWVVMASKILSMGPRTFCASIVGLATPYWLAGGYCMLTSNLDYFVIHFTEIAHFSPIFDCTMLNESKLITIAFILLIALTGIIHYLRTRQNDRIRIQMFYETFIIVDAVTIVFIVLQPQHYEALLGIIIVNTSPLIAHYIALTHTRWTNLSFKLMLLMVLLITICNLWMPSLTF